MEKIPRIKSTSVFGSFLYPLECPYFRGSAVPAQEWQLRYLTAITKPLQQKLRMPRSNIEELHMYLDGDSNSFEPCLYKENQIFV